MPGEKIQLTSLQSRKQLLLLESELNRVQLLKEWNGLKSEINQLQNQLHGFGSLASSAKVLFSLVSTFRRILKGPEDREKKTSWVSRLSKWMQMGAVLWSAVRGERR